MHIAAEELKNLADDIMQRAIVNLKHYKELMPVLFLITPKRIEICEVDDSVMENATTKNAFAQYVRQMVKEDDAVATLFLSEAWLATARQEDIKRGSYTAPADVPERREAIVLMSERKTESGVERIGRFQFFHREGLDTPNERIVIGEYKEHETAEESRFRFLEES